MINEILNLCKSYIDDNKLYLKINYLRNNDWYIIYFKLKDNKHLFKNKWIVSEYKNSIIIISNNNRFDISKKDLDDLLNRGTKRQEIFVNSIFK